MKLIMFQAVVLAGLLLVLVGATANVRVEPAERSHWDWRPATIAETLIHDLEQRRALEEAQRP